MVNNATTNIKRMREDIIKEYNEVIRENNVIFAPLRALVSFNNHISKKNSGINREDFREFINGLYQAEGTMGVYFPKEDSLRVRFNFSIGQNYSIEAVKVFSSLKKILGVGLIKLDFDLKDQAHVRYVISNTKDIFLILPYFSFLYGQKKGDIIRMERIYKLSLLLTTLSKKGVKPSIFFINEFINLVYSINPEGQQRKLSLKDKLDKFECGHLSYKEKLKIEENSNLPGKLFIIGLFLGDGSFGFVFDSPPSKVPNFYIKIVFNFAAQSYNNSNIELLELVAKAMSLKPQIYIRKSGMIGLEYTGDIVYSYIIPFLNEYTE